MSTPFANLTRNDTTVYENIEIPQGATWSSTVTLKTPNGSPFDLTNYSVRGQLRRQHASTTGISFTCTVTDAANGMFTMALTSVESAALRSPHTYVYDVEIYDGSSPPVVYRVLEGKAIIRPEVTRA